MIGETNVTIVGNLTADPDLRFTPSGVAVATVTVASTPRIYDRQSSKWRDSDTLFLRATVWREAAQQAADSLRRGDRVVVVGYLKQRTFEDKEGIKRTVVEVEADEIAASLRYATVAITRAGIPAAEEAAAGHGHPLQ